MVFITTSVLGAMRPRLIYTMKLPLKFQYRSVSYGRKIVFQEPTLSEMPVPEGSWEKHYSAANSKSTKHLIMGVSFFLFTMFVTFRSGLVTLNHKIPPLDGMYASNDGCAPPPPKKC